MIEVTYEYDNTPILNYRRYGDDELVLPRQDEFVEIGYTTYRVETITHVFAESSKFEQFITIKLTRQLLLRNL